MDDTEYGERDSKLVTDYRRLITEVSLAEQEKLDRVVQWVGVSEVARHRFTRMFPHYDKALYVYESGPDQICINSVREINSDGHSDLALSVARNGLSSDKSLIFKRTPHARMEWLMAQMYKVLDLDTYRVMPVEGIDKEHGTFWQFIQTDMRRTELGFDLPEYKRVPVIKSAYAVLEKIEGLMIRDQWSYIKGLDREAFLYLVERIGRLAAAEFVLGGIDLSSENVMMTKTPLRVYRIDREQHLYAFYRSLGRVDLNLLNTGWEDKEQTDCYMTGVNEQTGVIERNIDNLAHLVEVGSEIGVTSYYGKVEPIVVRQMKSQLEALKTETG
ncbi:hypothetical protein A2961_00440 [Candidatus Woesebacteria bacterium RIFCSPLOWO2_01_FULL_39_21]|uniref:Uncharacterized protein n=1 Tax=Candidatus Woesebacteria bacterium RIFCSPLOWO2_01_FULL_39_21 TaxID=1802519 RepID=A0A1F8BAU9_9BACT|nr:MAG: hypothetical protein A2691_00360 [Candidatus Woesebacteria bacterium RIFCSPHIGHO2_01_FULL_39_23]OGM61172.1 MAG: hypothetical protein A2961_00440 [Candidatus Woesebacteria bacterium RIFCSPLOWO2_01_FULL_39_21]